MKKRLLYLLYVLLFVCKSSAFTTTYISTNGGQLIQVRVYSSSEELPPDSIQAIDQYFISTFPNATFLDHSTRMYNCHSYAWNITDGGDLVCWLNSTTNNGSANLSKYWTNDYYGLTIESKARKIHYYNSDHSAVKSHTVSGLYESKWGSAPLMRHAPTYGPYLDMNSRNYYKHVILLVVGPLICSYGTGSIPKNIAAAYNASVSNNILSYTGSIEYLIETSDGDDAVENGKAVINNTSQTGMNVTFTSAGFYQMNIKYYDIDGDLIAHFSYEQIVTN